MLMIVDAFANKEPKNLVMDRINITFVVITVLITTNNVVVVE